MEGDTYSSIPCYPNWRNSQNLKASASAKLRLARCQSRRDRSQSRRPASPGSGAQPAV